MSNDLDLSLSLLEGIHQDDHEKITSLKNNSFTNLNKINNNSENIDLLFLNLNSSTNLNELYSNVFNNKNLFYFGCTSIIIGSLIKFF
jgi:hypothetical protein